MKLNLNRLYWLYRYHGLVSSREDFDISIDIDDYDPLQVILMYAPSKQGAELIFKWVHDEQDILKQKDKPMSEGAKKTLQWMMNKVAKRNG